MLVIRKQKFIVRLLCIKVFFFSLFTYFQCKNRVTGEMSNEWRYTNSGVTLNLYEFSGLYENLEKIETLIGLFQEQERKCIGEPGYTLSVEGNPLERHVSVMHSRDFLDPVTMVVFHSIIKKGSQVNIAILDTPRYYFRMKSKI